MKDDFYNGFKTLRSGSDQPFITLTEKMLIFSKSAINLLDKTPYVHALINEKEKAFLVEESKADRYSLSFVREIPKSKQLMVRWGSREILDPIRKIVGKQGSLRIWGEYYPEYKAIKFDLTDWQER